MSRDAKPSDISNAQGGDLSIASSVKANAHSDSTDAATVGSTSGGVRSIVVVPWHPHQVSEEESLSLKSIHRFAQGVEMVIVTPDASSLPPFLNPDRVEVFPAACFETFLANNRLIGICT